MELSIVLTVYNKGKFLNKALTSLLHQENSEHVDYEVIAVDDGSTDDSLQQLESFAIKYTRLKVISQPNQGLSMARNNGVGFADGEYIWFVDADDVVSPHSVRLICDAIVFHPDIIPIYAKTDGLPGIRNQIPVEVKNGKDILLTRKWEPCGVFWVMNREFLKRNNLSFFPNIYHEDSEFTPRMLYLSESVKVVPEVLYTVFQDAESITHVPHAKRAFDCITVAENLCSFVERNNEVDSLIGRIIDEQSSICINNAFNIIIQNSHEEQLRFELFLSKRPQLLRSLRNSSRLKYLIEAELLRLFPRKSLTIYKHMKKVGRIIAIK